MEKKPSENVLSGTPERKGPNFLVHLPPPQLDIARHVPFNKGACVRIMMLNITVVFSRSVVLTWI
jgi:hypothetical protein